MKRLLARGERGFEVLGGTPRSQAAELTLGPGRTIGGPDNRHENADQWLFVVRGHGQATVEGRTTDLEPGVVLLVEAGESHEIRNTAEGPLVTLNVYSPPTY
jgi:mannose-6-phosphate isomerase-like protein (cupin superfamily)